MAFATLTPANAQASIPRPEHPRPDWMRETWLNLNGTWEFGRDPEDAGLAGGWAEPSAPAFAETIVVPFPWQSPASGIAGPGYRGVAWYRRTFQVPDGWTDRVILKFGAVDYWTKVFVNGQLAGEHEGGYTPFEFDITDMLQPAGNVLTVRVEDPANLWEIPHGKQRSVPPNPWDDVSFTTTSGIWQTVWLESRPAEHIVQARITPDVANAQAVFDISATSGPITAEITAPDGAVTTHTLNVGTNTVPIPDPILWDIRQPNLYQVTLSIPASGDTVHTYFGMRSIERDGDQVLLNGRPIYTMSVLDQGYWPEGLYTAPSDDALRADVEYALSIGLNMIRKHIKIEDPRFYYWADQLGLLMWADMPSPVAFTELARTRLMQDMERAIERDYNHPSLVIWSPYNESWGLEFRSDLEIQNWMVEVYNQIKAWDSTRLVVDNSGWRHAMTDIADSHKYTDDPTEWRGTVGLLANDPMSLVVLGHPFFALGRHHYDGEPLMMTEYGVGWGGERVREFKWQTEEIRRQGNIVGYTYTELYDIEHELAGFATYDRTPKPLDYDLSIINSEDFIAVDGYRLETRVVAGSVVELPLFTSLYGAPTFASGTVRWRAERDGVVLVEGEMEPQAVVPYTTTGLAPLQWTAPESAGRVRLWIELFDGEERRAQNFIDLTVVEA